MARNWLDDLARVNRNTNVKEGDPIPAANILQAMDDADIPKEEQARILGIFMEVNKDTLGGDTPDKPEAADKPETTLTLQQIVAMAQDPSKRAELQALWAAMPEDKKKELIAQIEALKPEAAAKADDDAAAAPAVKDPATDLFIKRMKDVVANAKMTPEQKKDGIKEIFFNLIKNRADFLRDPKNKGYVDQVEQLLARTKLIGMNKDGWSDGLMTMLKKSFAPLSEATIRKITGIMEQVGLTWQDMGYSVTLTESRDVIFVGPLMPELKLNVAEEIMEGLSIRKKVKR